MTNDQIAMTNEEPAWYVLVIGAWSLVICLKLS